MPTLSWRHHTLIQALLSQGPLKEDAFRSIFSQVIGQSSGARQQQLLNEYLRKINAELSYVQFELRACRNQYDGVVYYGVVNNVSDEQSKLGTKYAVPQIAFYKGIVEAIVQDPEAKGSILNVDALYIRLESQLQSQGANDPQSNVGSSQVPAALKNFSISQKEKALEQLTKDQWLCTMPDGRIGLGVRSFLDLRSWFRSNDVPSCEVCNEAALKAQCCPNEACNVRLHLYCLRKKFSQQRSERICPGCSTKWPDMGTKAEHIQAEEHNEDPNMPSSQPSQLSSEHSKRQKRKFKREVDNVLNSASTSTSAASTNRRTTRSSARLG